MSVDRCVSLAEAAAVVQSGQTLALGGMTLYRRPVAFVRALLKQSARPVDLTLLSFTAGYESDLLVGAGCVARTRTCYFGLEVFGLAPMFTEAARQGRICVIEETEASLAFGMRAHLANVSFMPGLAWLGTDLLKLRPDVMGTDDGLSKFPYVRESRRILALQRIVEQDILAALRPGARQAGWRDSIGIGWYPMDLHPAIGNPRSMFEPTVPFQIPLGALIPRRTENLIAAGKNIGTTHLTNGAYRLHPVEWNIGESAGALAAFCCETGAVPRRVREEATLLARFQDRLRERGVPLDWAPVVGTVDKRRTSG